MHDRVGLDLPPVVQKSARLPAIRERVGIPASNVIRVSDLYATGDYRCGSSQRTQV